MINLSTLEYLRKAAVFLVFLCLLVLGFLGWVWFQGRPESNLTALVKPPTIGNFALGPEDDPDEHTATISAELAEPTAAATPSAKIKSPVIQKKPALLKKAFQAGEPVAAFVGEHALGSLKTAVAGNDGQEVAVKTSIADGVLTVDPVTSFRPGKYKIKIEQSDKSFLEEEFLWGVLAINTNQSVFSPGDEVYLQMAALNEWGHTLCDASLKLQITNPKSQITVLSTEDGTIQASPSCGANNVTDTPDYFAYLLVDEPGTYELTLTNLDNGYAVTDSFAVAEDLPFTVERVAATRINPFLANYWMTIKIRAQKDFDGSVQETLPAGFAVTQSENAQLETQNDLPRLIWPVALKNGETAELKYEYDAPDVSPALFLLGPLRFVSLPSTGSGQAGQASEDIVFQEARQWQVASDYTCVAIASGAWRATPSTTYWSGCNSTYPNGADTVQIGNFQMTIPSGENDTAASVTFTASGGSITVTSTGTLTISGAITVNNLAAASLSATLAGTGTISAGSIRVGGTVAPSAKAVNTTTLISTITSLTSSGNLTITSMKGASTRYNDATFTLSGGVTTVNGTVTTVTPDSGNTSTFTMANSTLKLGGATPWSLGTPGTNVITLNGAAAIVNYNSSSAQTVLVTGITGTAYTTLQINNSNASGATLEAAVTVTTLTIGNDNSAIFNDGGYQITSTGTLNLTAGTFNLGSAGAATAFPAFTAGRNISAGTTVGYVSGIAQTVSTTPSYSNLTFSGAGTKTSASNTLTIGGNWSVGSTTALNTNSTTVSLTGNLNGSGNITQGNLITVGGDWTNTGIFSASASGVTLTGSGRQITGPAGGISFTTLTVSGTYTSNNTGTITVSTSLAGVGTLTQGTGATLALTFTGALGITGLDAATYTNTVQYTAAGAQTVKAVNYSSLTLGNSGAKTLGAGTTAVSGALTLSGSATAATVVGLTVGSLTAGSSGIGLTLADYTFGVSGAASVTGTLTISASAANAKTFTGDVTVSGTWNETGAAPISFAGSLTNNATSWSASTGVHTFSGANKTISGATATVIPTVTVTGTVANSNTLTVATLLTVTSPGVLTNNGTITAAISLTGTGGLTQGASANLNLGGTVDISALTATAANNTVDYTGTGQTIRDTTYANLTISGTVSSGTQTATVAGVFSVTNTFTPSGGTITFNNGASISNSGTLAFVNVSVANSAAVSTSSSFSVSGNWSSGGTFTASDGTITFNGADGSTQAFTGDSSFKNFTATTTANSSGRTLQFAGGTETTVTGTWTITGYNLKVIILQSSNTDNWTITPTAANVTYVDVYRSTRLGTAFCATFSTKDVNCLNWTVSTGASCNTAPNSPSSLAQKKTTDAVLAVGDWTNETNVKFTATADDTDNPDTLYLCVEKKAIGVAFTGPEDGCSSLGVAYSGTPVEVTVTIAGVTDTEYHWRARVKDEGGLYSSWAAYGDNPAGDGSGDGSPANRDYGIDTSDPTLGDIYDGTEVGVDKDFSTTSLSELSANWANFDATVSGLNKYQYSIGTTQGGTDIKIWTDNSTTTSVTAVGLTLQTSAVYYFNVRAVDTAGNTQDPVISSDGQIVSPSLSFGVSPATLTFANLNSNNSYTDDEDATLTTSTNAYNGYVIRVFITDYLRSIVGDFTIPDFNGGTYVSPDGWLASDRGFGYTSSDTSVQGSNKFGSTPCPGGGDPPCYAPFSHDPPGEIVADHTANVSGDPISGEVFTIKCKVMTDNAKEAANYLTTIVYTITAQY